MDCNTKQRCPGCQAGSGSSGRRSASGPEMRSGMSGGPGPEMRSGMSGGPGPEMRSGMSGGTCPGMRSGMRSEMPSENIDQFPIAMAYVPWQRWGQIYPMEQALNRGTIFPELDKPFVMGRCQ